MLINGIKNTFMISIVAVGRDFIVSQSTHPFMKMLGKLQYLLRLMVILIQKSNNVRAILLTKFSESVDRDFLLKIFGDCLFCRSATFAHLYFLLIKSKFTIYKLYKSN